MATTEVKGGNSSGKQVPHGQGTSKSAIMRRKQAAKKAAARAAAEAESQVPVKKEDSEGRMSSESSPKVTATEPAASNNTWAHVCFTPSEGSPAIEPAPALPATPPQTPSLSSKSSEEGPRSPSPPLSTTPTDPVVSQDLDDLLVMIRQQRDELLTGPKITVYIGSTPIEGVWKRAAMASSSVLNDHFAKDPKSVEYRLEPDSASPEAVRYLLVTYLNEACQGFEASPVRMRYVFKEDIALLRASSMLGMGRYTEHIRHAVRGYLKHNLPSYEEIVFVEENTSSATEGVWTAMVNHLCYERYRKLMPDPEIFAEFLKKHPRLAAAMDSADEYFASTAKARYQVREEEKRARWEENRAWWQEQNAKRKEVACSLRQKMDAKGGSSLMMATAEEAELLRNS